jgi:hypothetical protein
MVSLGGICGIFSGMFIASLEGDGNKGEMNGKVNERG